MYFLEQLKKGFFCRETVFVLLVSIGSYFFFGEDRMNYDGDFLSDFTITQSDNILIIIFPILLCLPMAMKIVTELESGYFDLVVIRTSIKKYILTKVLCNGLVGGVLLALPAFIYLIRLIAAKGGEVNSFEDSARQINLFPTLFETHPMVYSTIILAGLFLCGVAFATLALGIAAITRKKYLALLVPFCYYIGSAILFCNLKKSLDATTLYDLNANNNPNLLINLLYDLAILAVGLAVFVKGVGQNVE